MTPFVETLATLLEKFPVGRLTLVDVDAHPRTRPLVSLRTRFNGHVWLHAGMDPTPAIEIGGGAEVSVAYGSMETGAHVTIHGWAIALRNSAYVRSVLGLQGFPVLNPWDASTPLICITARAAEMWDEDSRTSPRIFAFASAQPGAADDPDELLPQLTGPVRWPRSAALGCTL